MGQNLELYIDKWGMFKHRHWMAGDCLTVHRDAMMGVLMDDGEEPCQIKERNMPKDMKFFFPDSDLKKPEDNDELSWVYAGDLAKVKPPKETCSWNRAILKFMAAIDPKTVVVLRWM